MSSLVHGAMDGLWSIDPFDIPIALRRAMVAYTRGWNQRDREIFDAERNKVRR